MVDQNTWFEANEVNQFLESKAQLSTANCISLQPIKQQNDFKAILLCKLQQVFKIAMKLPNSSHRKVYEKLTNRSL